MWWLMLLGCPPKAPLPDSVAMTRAAAPELAELGYGQSLPRDADPDALESMREGEAILLALSELVPADTSVDSREQAIYVSEQADEALAWFSHAGQDSALRVPSQARAGDTYRIAYDAVMRTLPSPALLPDDVVAYDAMVAEAGRPLAEDARTAYERVLGDPMAPPVWKAHARWGLVELEVE